MTNRLLMAFTPDPRHLALLHQMSKVESWALVDFNAVEKRLLKDLLAQGLVQHDRALGMDIYTLTDAGKEAVRSNEPG